VFAPGTDEDKLMEAALDAGAEDVVGSEDGSIEVLTGPYDFVTVKDALAKAGFAAEFAEVTMKPGADVEMSGEDSTRMQKLLDALEALDDVQAVYTSAVLDAA
jgi:transcriptional/translational regulatory protein YebC/TACO1